MTGAYTHEQYIHAVRDLAAIRIPVADRTLLYDTKLVYGAGESGLRGVTHYGRWKNGHPTDAHPFVEVCAFGEESPVQVAGTTIHELAHVLAGPGAGHGPLWHAACARLGLCKVLAAGTTYQEECFDADLWVTVNALPKPTDGKPVEYGGIDRLARLGIPMQFKLRPCGMGIGTRGGKSRGVGSGSRLRKFACGCGVIARVARMDFLATCNLCSTPFAPAEAIKRNLSA